MTKHNVTDFLDTAKFNRFHGLILFCTMFLIVIDGYDLVVYGAVVPSLMEAWSISPVQAGTLGSYALIGMMLGALTLGALGDKFGRKTISIFCMLLFSVFMILSGFASGATDFGIYRFITGLGLGGLMPNVIALMTEYSPKRNRSMIVAFMFNGYSIGGIISALSSLALISTLGWKYVFILGVLIPLILSPFIAALLPETPQYYLAKNKQEKLAKILKKINPAIQIQPDAQFEINVEKKKGVPIVHLFRNKRGTSTLMFWITFFMSLLTIYGFNTWLPNLMVDAGYALASGIWFLLVFNGGAAFGSLMGGWLSDRFGARKVLVVFYLIGALCILTIGFNPSAVLLYILVFITGSTTLGSQNVGNAFVSQYYPSDLRSTGTGAALGVGRIGGILGPYLGGLLVSMGVSFQGNFLVFAIPGLLAAIAIGFVKDKYGEISRAGKQEVVLK